MRQDGDGDPGAPRWDESATPTPTRPRPIHARGREIETNSPIAATSMNDSVSTLTLNATTSEFTLEQLDKQQSRRSSQDDGYSPKEAKVDLDDPFIQTLGSGVETTSIELSALTQLNKTHNPAALTKHTTKDRRVSHRGGDIQSIRDELKSASEELPEEKEKPKWRREDVDGNYGWVIVASSFLIVFNYLGLLYSWGVIQAELVEQEVNSTKMLSIVGGLQTFFSAAGSPLAAILIRKIGPKWSAVIATLTQAMGYILSSFCFKSYAGLLILQGIIVGNACALNFMTTVPLPTQWFLKKRGLATGITSAGGGLGGAAFSIIVNKLIQSVGLAWSFRIMGFILIAFALPVAFLLKPGPILSQAQPEDYPGDKPLFKIPAFLWLMAAFLTISYPFYIPAFFIPQYAKSVGYSASTGALFGAGYNLASGAGRVAFGAFADFAVGNITSWIVALAAVAISTLCIWPFAYAKAVIAIFVIIVGMGSGGFFSLQCTITAQIVGAHRLDKALSVLELVVSAGFFAGPVSGGFLLDAFGGPSAGAKAYRPVMYLVGGTAVVATLCAIRIRMLYTNNTLFVKA